MTAVCGGDSLRSPHRITLDADGRLWVILEFSGEVARLACVGGEARISPHGLTVGGVPISIEPGPDGTLWCAEPGADRVGRVTTGAGPRPSGEAAFVPA